jgi:hypothetical protein
MNVNLAGLGAHINASACLLSIERGRSLGKRSSRSPARSERLPAFHFIGYSEYSLAVESFQLVDQTFIRLPLKSSSRSRQPFPWLPAHLFPQCSRTQNGSKPSYPSQSNNTSLYTRPPLQLFIVNFYAKRSILMLSYFH